MGEDTLARRLVTARFAEGEADRGRGAAADGGADARKLPARFVASAMTVYGAASGVWVGGTATLTRTDVVFAANRLARAVRGGMLDAAVPLREVRAVFVTTSFPADVVTVVGERLTMRLRCRRAQAFADRIAVAASTGTT